MVTAVAALVFEPTLRRGRTRPVVSSVAAPHGSQPEAHVPGSRLARTHRTSWTQWFRSCRSCRGWLRFGCKRGSTCRVRQDIWSGALGQDRVPETGLGPVFAQDRDGFLDFGSSVRDPVGLLVRQLVSCRRRRTVEIGPGASPLRDFHGAPTRSRRPPRLRSGVAGGMVSGPSGPGAVATYASARWQKPEWPGRVFVALMGRRCPTRYRPVWSSSRPVNRSDARSRPPSRP